MANDLEVRAYRPIDADSGGGPAAMLRALFTLIVVVSVALILWPAGLRYLAPGVPAADPQHATIVRMAAFAAFLLSMTLLGIGQQSRRAGRRRESWSAFAAEVGGSLRQAPARPAKGGGVEGGLEVTFLVGSYPAVLSAGATLPSRSPSSHQTRLAATAVLLRDFQFQVLPNTSVNRVLMSPNVWKPILAAARNQAETQAGNAEQATAVDRIDFLASDAVVTGDAELDRACLIKATDESLVRDLVADPGVRSALAALQAVERGWRITLLSASASSPARLEVEVPGWDKDLPRLRAMHGLLKATLERLGQQRVLGSAAA